MHLESLSAMTQAVNQISLNQISGEQLSVLDVGSFDVNGSFRPLVEDRGWKYTGLDIVDGKNVDVVTADPYSYPFPDGHFDVVISGSTMEHVEAIWKWIPELARLVKLGGWLVVLTQHAGGEHRHPVDCWRIFPDGMRFLFDMTDKLKVYHIQKISVYDTIGIARRCK